MIAGCSQTPANGRGRNSRDIPGPIPGLEYGEVTWPPLGLGSPFPPSDSAGQYRHFPTIFLSFLHGLVSSAAFVLPFLSGDQALLWEPPVTLVTSEILVVLFFALKSYFLYLYFLAVSVEAASAWVHGVAKHLQVTKTA